MIAYRSSPEDRTPIDIQGVHSLFSGVLSGYAGISTILIWITFLATALATVPPSDPSFSVVYLFIFLPFIISGFFTIPTYIYEKRLSRMSERLASHLEKIGFEKIKTPQFEKEE